MQPFNSEVLAVHAALLHTRKVLFAAGSGNSFVRFSNTDFGNTAKGNWTSVVWDPSIPPAGGPKFFHPDTLRGMDNRPIDFFCGGESFLADAGNTAYSHPGHESAALPGDPTRAPSLSPSVVLFTDTVIAPLDWSAATVASTAELPP